MYRTNISKYIILGLNYILSFLFIHFAHATEQERIINTPFIDARAWILIDYASGKVLAEGNADNKLDPASLTKIMTSYIIGDFIKAGKIKFNDVVTVGKDAWATGNPILKGSSVMFIKPGDQVSVEELNKGVIIQSGNDACIALADYISGSQDNFINLMNKYAKKLGLVNTIFKTVHGLDTPGQFSTARDIAILSRSLIHDLPEEYITYKEKEFTFNNIHQLNRNRLLWNSNIYVDGIKTGTTTGAGYNLAASAVQGGMRLISVVFGTKTDHMRFQESEKLLTWGFNSFETITPIKSGTNFISQRIWFGDQKKVNLGVNKSCVIVIPRNQSQNLKTSIKLNRLQLTAPIKKGQIVGTINFQLSGNSVAQCPLIVMEQVNRGSLFNQIWDFLLIKFNKYI